MMRAERMLESRVRRSGIDEIRPTELANVAETLEDFGVDELKGQLVDADVVPDRVAQDLESHAPLVSLVSRQAFGPAFLIAVSTSPNFSKLSRNMPASFFACAS